MNRNILFIFASLIMSVFGASVEHSYASSFSALSDKELSNALDETNKVLDGNSDVVFYNKSSEHDLGNDYMEQKHIDDEDINEDHLHALNQLKNQLNEELKNREKARFNK